LARMHHPMRHGLVSAAFAVAVAAGLPAPARADAIDDSLENLNQRNIAFSVQEFIDLVGRNDYENVRVFLQAGMDPNTLRFGVPVLLEASMRGYTDTVKVLLEGGANPRLKNERSWTALHLAVFFSHKEVVEALLERGAEVSAKTEYGLTPLHFAIQERNVEIAEILFRKGASPTVKSRSGVSGLTIAVDLNEKPLVKLMESHGYGPQMKALRQQYAEEKAAAEREADKRSKEVAKKFKDQMGAATGGRRSGAEE